MYVCIIDIECYRSINVQSLTAQKSFIDWHQLLAQARPGPRNRHHARYMGDEIGKKKFRPSLLSTKSAPRSTCTRFTHLPIIAFPCHNAYARCLHREALLNIMCIVKGYHLCHLEVNFGEVFTANQKRGECGNAFKVVNHHGQLGHQSIPIDTNLSISIGIDNQ